jgi:hypothetical protein
MYNLLRVVLKQVGYVPTEKPEKPVKTRVVPFDDMAYMATTYVAQYKRYGVWWRFTEFFQLGSDPNSGIWKTDHPVISQNFDKLVRFCKRFKTHEDVDEYHRQEEIKYKRAYAEFIDKSGCNRKWESD